jgi:hypothetical protein
MNEEWNTLLLESSQQVDFKKLTSLHAWLPATSKSNTCSWTYWMIQTTTWPDTLAPVAMMYMMKALPGSRIGLYNKIEIFNRLS